MEKVSSSSQRAAGAEEQKGNGSAMTQIESPLPVVELPRKTLIVLCGPAGAGKSTFAQHFVKQHWVQGYRPTSVVSSDHCRALICDDENNQQVNRDTFELFYFLLHKRLPLGYPTIADSTALQNHSRQALLEIAQRYQFQTCLFIFNMSLATCVGNDQRQERGRTVGVEVIAYHIELLQQALPEIAKESWDHVCVLDEQRREVTVTFQP
jgi:predicted kinase